MRRSQHNLHTRSARTLSTLGAHDTHSQRAYLAWFTAGTTSAAGTSIRTLAISLLGFALTQSTTLAGWVGTLSLIAQLIAGITGDTFMDRHHRRVSLVINSVCSAMGWGLVCLLLVGHLLSFPLFLSLCIAMSLINGFLSSASDALLKSVIPLEDYESTQPQPGGDALIFLSGNPLSGFLFALHTWFPFAIRALLYACLGGATDAIPRTAEIEHAQNDDPQAHFRQDFVDGWTWTFSKHMLVIILLARSLTNFFSFRRAVHDSASLGFHAYQFHAYRLHQRRYGCVHARRLNFYATLQPSPACGARNGFLPGICEYTLSALTDFYVLSPDFDTQLLDRSGDPCNECTPPRIRFHASPRYHARSAYHHYECPRSSIIFAVWRYGRPPARAHLV